MDLVNSVAVRVKGSDSIPSLLDDINAKVARRAYEIYMERGSVHGHDLDDWLQAERELLIKPVPEINTTADELFVEVTLPDIDMQNLT